MSSKYNGNPDESNISNTMYKKWLTISGELQYIFVIVLHDMIKVRDGGKASESLG